MDVLNDKIYTHNINILENNTTPPYTSLYILDTKIQNQVRELSSGRTVFRENCLQGELSSERTVFRDNCLQRELSSGRTVFRENCLQGELSSGRTRNSLYTLQFLLTSSSTGANRTVM
jgi:hypothetical protein